MEDNERPARLEPARSRRRRPHIPRPPGFIRRFARFWRGRPLLLATFMALIGAGITFSGTQALTWMETPAFCGRCHTMGPEVAAHERSAHADVECAECHVGKGLVGLAKAKIGGMRQMVELALGDYARPIPPAADRMPPASETCTRCHDPSRERSDLLITRTHYADDQKNTPQQVGLVMRLAHEEGQSTPGIHWHVLSTVKFTAAEDGSVSWIGVDKTDGSHEEFIAGAQVQMTGQALEKAIEIQATTPVTRMSCYDCHNRVGHDFPTPGQAMDTALSEKRIKDDIPYIKKNGVALVSATYTSLDAFDQALRALEQTYFKEYSYLYLERPDEMRQAFASLRAVYIESASPEMNAKSVDYPNLLGHTASTGCFRCHDGGHFKIVDGQMTKQAIPSACSTCHTFPSVGGTSLPPIGEPPTSHSSDRLWVFNHKTAPGAKNPTAATCDACHAQAYCQNCHAKTINVKHDQMLTNHAQVIRNYGVDACGYCHQKPFCTRCHTNGIPK